MVHSLWFVQCFLVQGISLQSGLTEFQHEPPDCACGEPMFLISVHITSFWQLYILHACSWSSFASNRCEPAHVRPLHQCWTRPGSLNMVHSLWFVQCFLVQGISLQSGLTEFQHEPPDCACGEPMFLISVHITSFWQLYILHACSCSSFASNRCEPAHVRPLHQCCTRPSSLNMVHSLWFVQCFLVQGISLQSGLTEFQHEPPDCACGEPMFLISVHITSFWQLYIMHACSCSSFASNRCEPAHVRPLHQCCTRPSSLNMVHSLWFVQCFLVQGISLQSGLTEFQHEPPDCACEEPMFLISVHITSFWQLYILHACSCSSFASNRCEPAHVRPLHQCCTRQAVWTWYIVCDLCSASLYRAFLYNQVWLSSSMNLQIVLVGNPCSLFQSILHLFGSCISCMPAHGHPLHQIDASLLMFVLCINVELGQAVWTWYIVCDLCSASLYRAFLYNQVWLSSSMNLQIVLVGNPCSLFQSILHLFVSCISCMPAHGHPLHQIDASLLMFVLCINVELGQAVWTWYIVCDLCSASLYRAFLYNQVWLSSSMNLQIVLVGNPCSLFQSILHLFGSCISCMPAHGHPLHQIDASLLMFVLCINVELGQAVWTWYIVCDLCSASLYRGVSLQRCLSSAWTSKLCLWVPMFLISFHITPAFCGLMFSVAVAY